MINIILWIIYGAVVGWVAGRLIKGGGFGFITNAILGIIGSFVGGGVFSYFGVGIGGPIGNFMAAVVGAILVIMAANFLKRLNR